MSASLPDEAETTDDAATTSGEVSKQPEAVSGPVDTAMASGEVSKQPEAVSGPVDTAADVEELEAGPEAPPPPPPVKPRAAPQPAPAVLPETLNTRDDLPPRQWPPKTVADLMVRQVIAVDETEPLGDLEDAMGRFRFHHLPVVSDGRKLVGLITRADFLHAALGRTPNGLPTLERVDASTPAGVVMRQRLITATIDTPIVTALRVMVAEKLSCLPVVLEDATLVGIVTSGDFMRLALEVFEKTAP